MSSIADSNVFLIDGDPVIKLNEFESLSCRVMTLNSVFDVEKQIFNPVKI